MLLTGRQSRRPLIDFYSAPEAPLRARTKQSRVNFVLFNFYSEAGNDRDAFYPAMGKEKDP